MENVVLETAGNLTNEAGGNITGTVTNRGIVTNEGTISTLDNRGAATNNGTISSVSANGGYLTNNGTISGAVSVNDQATVINQTGGTINNTVTVNGEYAEFDMTGGSVNASGSTTAIATKKGTTSITGGSVTAKSSEAKEISASNLDPVITNENPGGTAPDKTSVSTSTATVTVNADGTVTVNF